MYIHACTVGGEGGRYVFSQKQMSMRREAGKTRHDFRVHTLRGKSSRKKATVQQVSPIHCCDLVCLFSFLSARFCLIKSPFRFL